jgi:hypothetical protein
VAIVRVNPNLEAELTGARASHGPLERVLGDAAEDIAREARAIGRAEFYRRGGYVRGIRAEHGMNEWGELVGRVVATDWKSHWGEYGWKRRTGGTRARHVLTRAATRIGFEVLAATLAGPGRTLARR